MIYPARKLYTVPRVAGLINESLYCKCVIVFTYLYTSQPQHKSTIARAYYCIALIECHVIDITLGAEAAPGYDSLSVHLSVCL